jgi:hypothetical protein
MTFRDASVPSAGGAPFTHLSRTHDAVSLKEKERKRSLTCSVKEWIKQWHT